MAFFFNIYFIFIIIILRTNIILTHIKYEYKINILFVFPIKGNFGPSILARSYIETIKIIAKDIYLSKYFNLKLVSYIPFKNYINYTSYKNNLIWFLFADYFDKFNKESHIQYSNTIYGPMVSPKKWLLFPMNNTYETNWSNYINRLFAYIVQSERVKNHLISNSLKLKDIEKKYIVSHGCILSKENSSVLEWKKRYTDVLIYAKFADINKEEDLNKLLASLKGKYNVKLLKYGNHSKNSLIEYSNNSKILLYYSFYDCWPASLMEMENMGIYPIVQHCEFIDKYGTCINNFNCSLNKLLCIINNIIKHIHNSSEISNYYKKRNSCMNIFQNTLFDIYYKKQKRYI